VSARVRVLGYVVQPLLVVDDGDTLVPINVQSSQVTVEQWPMVQEAMAAAVAQFEAQFEASQAPATPPVTPPVTPNPAGRRHPPKT
jgi:hypothetical protein